MRFKFFSVNNAIFPFEPNFKLDLLWQITSFSNGKNREFALNCFEELITEINKLRCDLARNSVPQSRSCVALPLIKKNRGGSCAALL